MVMIFFILQVAEALDLVTATINLLLLCKVTDLDFNKHIEKLNAYRNGKYKKMKRWNW
ncbi:hypothetical protein [Fusobacterium polymorphum]|uniref:hypothetical protein n=1 Tax=Fusobacterium nucleatum subsp. polymorphum TaxID=76857 RepID=UPI00164E3AC8|nr:hypothetical protein [Fusobacterium polymorphum]